MLNTGTGQSKEHSTGDSIFSQVSRTLAPTQGVIAIINRHLLIRDKWVGLRGRQSGKMGKHKS